MILQGQQLIGFCANNGCGSGNCYKESGTCCQVSVIIDSLWLTSHY